MIAHFHEEQPNGCPDEFADTADDADEHADIGSHAHLCDGHGETSFAASQLEGHEEKEIGEEAGEGQYQEGIHKTEPTACACLEENEHEEDFKALEDAPDVFKCETGIKTFLVLRLEFGDLSVNLQQVFVMNFRKVF